ncbi:SusF/SusE family outer membrane protein [Aquimarina rhabdastrellae]
MRKVKYILVALLAVGLWSCSDDDADLNILGGETLNSAATLNTPDVTSFEVIETVDGSVDGNEDTEAAQFSWSQVEGSYNGAILNTLQIDIAGNNFNTATSLPLNSEGTVELTQSVTFGQLNEAINLINDQLTTAGSPLSVDFANGSEFEVRVMSASQSSGDQAFSTPITITVKGIEQIIVAEPKLFIVGSIQGYYGVNNWTPTEAIELRYIGDGTTRVFEGYIKASASDEFKLVSNQAAWDDLVGNYGTIGGVQDGNLENSGASGNITVSEDGNYYLQVDIDNLTYRLIKMEWGVIGDATPDGWTSETAMTYNFDENKWEVTITLVAGPFKFRSVQLSQEIFGEDWKFNVGTGLTAWDTGDGNFEIASDIDGVTVSFDVAGNATVTGL